MDAALIANVCVDSRKGSQLPGIVSLTLKKAYDFVNWNFLLKVLRDMGFGTKWINCITFCIRTVTFSVLINGSPQGFFAYERRLWQGDPLTPFLFLIAMEGLGQMFREAKRNGWFSGFKASNSEESHFTITHLLYADESLVFCDLMLRN